MAATLLRTATTFAAGGLVRVQPIEAARTDYQNRWAVVIGIDDYADTSFSQLGFAVNDAQAVRDLLVSEFAFPEQHVRFLKNQDASGKGIRAVFEQWLPRQGIGTHDAVLVFFAGHGFLSRDGRGGSIAAADTRVDQLEGSAIGVDWLHAQLNRLRPAGGQAEQIHKLIILDSCYSGSLFENVRRSDIPTRARLLQEHYAQSGQDGLGFYLRRPAFFAMSAGRFTPVADGSASSAHSIFTSALLRVLRERADSARSDHAFTFRQLAIQVEGLVLNAIGSQQVPDWGPVEPSDGDFVFLPHPDKRAVADAETPWSGDNRLTPSEERQLARRRQRYALDMATAWELFERGDIREVTKQLQKQLPDPGQPDIRAFDWYYLFRLCHAERMRASIPGEDWRDHRVVRATAISADGRFLAASVGRESDAWASTIHVWRLSPGTTKHLYTIPSRKGIDTLAFSPDNRWLAGGWWYEPPEKEKDPQGGAVLWRLGEDRAPEPEALPGDSAVLFLSFSPDSRYLVASSGSREPGISLWTMSRRRDAPLRLQGKSTFLSIGISPDAKTLLAADWKGSLWRWSIPSRKLLNVHSYYGDGVRVSLSPNGRIMALVDSTVGHASVLFVDLERGSKQPVALPANQLPGKVIFAEDGLRALVLIGGSSHALSIDPKTGLILAHVLTPSIEDREPRQSHVFAKRTFVSADGSEILLWDTERNLSHSHLRVLSALPVHFPLHALSPDARWLAIAEQAGSISLWDVEKEEKLPSIAWPIERDIAGLAISPDGSKLAIGDRSATDERLWIYDFATGFRRLLTQNEVRHSINLETLAFSPDGRLLMTVHPNTGSYGLWLTASGERLANVFGRGGQGVPPLIGHYGVLPEGKSVFRINSLNQFLETDLVGKQILRQIQPFTLGHMSRSEFSGVSAISRTGRWWAAGFERGSIGIVDLREPGAPPTITGQHFKGVSAAIFDLSTRTLVSGSEDGAVRLWLPTGEPLHEVRPSTTGAYTQLVVDITNGDPYATGIRSLAFAADDSALVALAEPGNVEIWHAAREEEVIARSENALRYKDLPETRINLIRSYWAQALRTRRGDVQASIAAARKALALLDELESARPSAIPQSAEWRRALQALVLLSAPN